MRPLRNIQILLFLLGFSWTLLQLPLKLAAPGFGQPYELTTVANNLATSGEFRDPFGISTGPTAHVAPVYPLIFAAAIKIFREPVTVIVAMAFLNAFLFGRAAALLPVLSRHIYGYAAPGIAGGILLAAASWLMPQWEAALSSLLFLMAALAMLQRRPMPAGLLSGACLLANPACLPALAVLAIDRNRAGPVPSGTFQGKRFAILVAGFALIVCAPWVLRNWIAVGEPFFVRDNLGLELYISNNDSASPELITNWPLWHLHPNQNPDEAKLVAALGEGRYNQMRFWDACAWIRTHPWQFLKLSAARTWYFWFPSPNEGWPAYLYWIASALGIWGVWVARKKRLVLSLALAAVIYSATFMAISTHLRYRYPSLWIAALFAGCGVIEIMGSAGLFSAPASYDSTDTVQ